MWIGLRHGCRKALSDMSMYDNSLARPSKTSREGKVNDGVAPCLEVATMKRFVITTLAALSLVGPALGGEGREVYTEDGKIRYGTGCTLNIHGLTRTGKCNVGRGWGNSSSIIQVGGVFFRIKRDPNDKTSAMFYRITNGDAQYVSEVYANGSCWVGTNVRFCAN